MKGREIRKKYQTRYQTIINCLHPVRAKGIEGNVYNHKKIVSLAKGKMDLLKCFKSFLV